MQDSSRHTSGVSRMPGTKEALSSRAGLSSTVRSPLPGATGGADTQAPLSKHSVLPFPIRALLLRKVKKKLRFCSVEIRVLQLSARGPASASCQWRCHLGPSTEPRGKAEKLRLAAGERRRKARTKGLAKDNGSLTSEKRERKKQTNNGRGTAAQGPSSRGSRSSAF